MVKYILTGLLILLISSGASAQGIDQLAQGVGQKQQLYVTDKLRLSLYQEAGGKGGVIKLLASGDKLTVEEVDGAYALVTTSEGKTGWAKRGFLVLDPTSNLMLEEEKKITESLIQEIDKLKNSKVIIDQYEKDLDAMNENLQALILAKENAESTVQILQQVVEEKTLKIEALSDYRALPAMELLNTLTAVYWKHMLVIAMLIMLTGFFIGKLIIEAKVKKKFRGIKVW